jgi:apolipoprotein N-acyltransferase
LVRVANTGISVAFDARGHELGRIDMNTTGTLAVPLPAALAATAFSRFGLWLPALMALSIVCGGVVTGYKRRN